MILGCVSRQSKAERVAVGAGDGVSMICRSRDEVGTSVLCGSGWRLGGGLGVNSILWVNEQAARSVSAVEKTNLEIFISAMLP